MKIFEKDYILSLDIGTSALKFAWLSKKQDKMRLVKAGVKEFPRTQNTSLLDKEIISSLKNISQNDIDLKRSKVIVTFNSMTTSIKKIKAPYMPKSELREGLMLEAKNYFPFPLDDTFLDFEIIRDVVEQGIRKYEVLLSVSSTPVIHKYLELLRKAGIRPASFIPASYALYKLAGEMPRKTDEIKCYLDIGDAVTELLIFRGADMEFSRKIPMGGNDFTKALTEMPFSEESPQKFSRHEAEEIKRKIGIPFGNEENLENKKISMVRVRSMLRDPVERLTDEISRCFDYYREQTGGIRVSDLIIFGGGASLEGLIKVLSESLHADVTLGDPLAGINTDADAIKDKDKISYRLDQAVGAAFVEEKDVNLLPVEIRDEAKRIFQRATVQALIAAILLISLFLYVGMRIQLNNYKKRIDVARLEISSLRPQLKKLEVHYLANKILVSEPHWEDIYKELSNIIPSNIHLTDISMENNVITMRGIVSSEDGVQLISDFMIKLEKGIFKNTKLVSSIDLEDRPGNEFEIRCWVE